MLKRIKEVNRALPGMIFIDLLYLVIGELIILAFVPNKLLCMSGLFFGVVYSIFSSIHLGLRIRKVVYGGGETTKTLVLGYIIRFGVMIAVFALLYIFNIGDMVCAIIGMFSMKVAAYLAPFTDKLFLDKGENSEEVEENPTDKNLIEKESE